MTLKPQVNQASGADYERDTGNGPISNGTPQNRRPDFRALVSSFGSSVAFMSNPISLFEAAKSAPNNVNAAMVAQINAGIDTISAQGGSSGNLRSRLAEVTNGKV